MSAAKDSTSMSLSLRSCSTLFVFRCNTFHDKRTLDDVCVTGTHLHTVTGVFLCLDLHPMSAVWPLPLP